MELQALRANEKYFINFLLNGLSDDCKEINEQCRDFLEVHGGRMKEALKALGEEDEDMKSEDNSAVNPED